MSEQERASGLPARERHDGEVDDQEHQSEAAHRPKRGCGETAHGSSSIRGCSTKISTTKTIVNVGQDPRGGRPEHAAEAEDASDEDAYSCRSGCEFPRRGPAAGSGLPFSDSGRLRHGESEGKGHRVECERR